MGKFKVTKGNMGAGKSARAIIEIDNHRRANLRVFVIKPKEDNRDGEYIRSRAINEDLKVKADLVLGRGEILPIDKLIQEEYDYIVVDEYHMLDAEIIKQLNYIASKCKTSISLYGLTISFTGEPFEAVKYALAYADEIIKITSENKLGREKMYHVLYVDGAPVNINTADDIKTGDLDCYDTVCREEFYTIYNKICKERWGLK